MLIRRITLGLCGLLLMACGGQQPGAASEQAITQLVDTLQQGGIMAQRTGPSNIAWLNSAPGHAYRLNDGNLFIHAYSSAETAQNVAAQIPPRADDGQTDWAGPPHFFRCDDLIVLYVGQAPAVTSSLTERCGPQFAGQ